MSFKLEIDPREAAYVRLAGDIYDMLNNVVHAREKQGVSRAKIARRMEKNRSQLSRILNGNNSNVTIRTIADILYATDFEMDRPVVCQLDEHGCNHRRIEPENIHLVWDGPAVVVGNASSPTKASPAATWPTAQAA